MKNKLVTNLGIFVVSTFLAACSSAPQAAPPQPLNTLPPTWRQTSTPDQANTPTPTTRTITATSTNIADLDTTFDAFQLTNAIPTNTRAPGRFELTNIANTNLMRTPSPTSTEGPPLRAHTWIPDPVLVEMWKGGGDGGPYFNFPPDLILYSDGQVILSNQIDFYTYKPLVRNLGRKSMCQLLNTIDQTGFFDYEPSIYRSPRAGGGSTRISVNTWQSNLAQHTDLFEFIFRDDYENVLGCDICLPPPIIRPALADTYKLLHSYNPGGLKYYQPEKLIVWLKEGSLLYEKAQAWPLSSPTLQELTEGNNFRTDYIIIEGEMVSTWYDQVPNGLYFEGSLDIEVLSRPMWPYEKETDRDFYGSSIPSSDYPTPTKPIECKVIDGILPIP